MKTKEIILNVILSFGITFITAIIITLVWNLLIEKTGATVDWGISIILAIIFSVLIPIVRLKNKTN